MIIKNLKYDPKHANKQMRAYNHLEYLDSVLTLDKAKKVLEYQKKRGFAPTIEIIEKQKKVKKAEDKAPDLKLSE